jgi:hypothetical protein
MRRLVKHAKCRGKTLSLMKLSRENIQPTATQFATLKCKAGDVASVMSWLEDELSPKTLPLPRGLPTEVVFNIYMFTLPAEQFLMYTFAASSNRFFRRLQSCPLFVASGDRTASIKATHGVVVAIGIVPRWCRRRCCRPPLLVVLSSVLRLL